MLTDATGQRRHEASGPEESLLGREEQAPVCYFLGTRNTSRSEIKKRIRVASQVAQWSRIRLPTQETWVRPVPGLGRSHLPRSNQ